ncbi:MAG TPA: hypothetical protein VFZ70_14345 [Euzebyales bacterium]
MSTDFTTDHSSSNGSHNVRNGQRLEPSPLPVWSSISPPEIVNLRAGPVDVIMDDGQTIHLAPLERRPLAHGDTSRMDMKKVRNSRFIRLERLRKGPSRLTGILAALGTVVIVAVLLTALLPFVSVPWFSVTWIAVASIGIALWLAHAVWRRGWQGARRWLVQLGSLTIVLVVTILLPGAVAWHVGRLSGTVNSVSDLFMFLAEVENASLAAAWMLQWLLIALASLLPALLYFLFDRTQLGTLKHEFIHDALRLDPTMQTLSDLDAKYGRQIEETYGTVSKGDAELAAGRRSPVVVATLLISIGWTALMIHSGNGLPVDVAPPQFRMTDFWRPPPSPVAFAFLGAYVFGLRTALQGHVRGDLQAKSYSGMSVRLMIAVITAWLLEVVIGGPARPLQGAAFFAGFMPDEWLRYLNERVKSFFGRKSDEGDEKSLPRDDLSGLIGLDIYDRTRLADEGVDHFQALAKPDLVALLMRTRIPASRLLDWVDQAVLQLHTSRSTDSGRLERNRIFDELQRAGIRTATQVLFWKDARPAIVGRTREEQSQWETLVRTLKRDPTAKSLLNWRKTNLGARRVETIDVKQDLPVGSAGSSMTLSESVAR